MNSSEEATPVRLEANLTGRMLAIRQINQAKSFTHTQRRVLWTLATFLPIDDLDAGWALKTSTLAEETFGEVTPSTLNMTRKALRELEEAGHIERIWAGSRKDHNDIATYYINWPGRAAETASITHLTVVPHTTVS